jgi:hypothetical protein
MAVLRVSCALVVVGTALLGCGTDVGPDPRTPAEMTAPSHLDWRALARDLADEIARGAAERGDLGPAVLASVRGGAPAYFRDLLLAELVGRGMRIAETAEAPLRIECRTTSLGVVPILRGARGNSATPPGEILVLCLLARDGAYIAAAQRSLVAPAHPEPPVEGIVIEVTG